MLLVEESVVTGEMSLYEWVGVCGRMWSGQYIYLQCLLLCYCVRSLCVVHVKYSEAPEFRII